ncbi:MAG: hypothetical protein CVV61_07620 [Tenericutes bacterium HGW-Tenericutes-6]|jgi:putative protease|nr:MAG: hypothetical protein CVV61_07620 [Tenericutes bacterium HGW-Tenericutes-6]
MKFLATIYDINSIKDILAYADGIILGHRSIGTRLTHSFEKDEIIEAISITKSLHKEVFIQANQLFMDDELLLFEAFIKELPLKDVKGIVVADLGAYRVLKKLGFVEKVIYNPETLLTNHYDFNFLKQDHILGVYVAKEITLRDLEEIGSKKAYHMFMVGHGHLNMFYSKRQLIKTYTEYIDKENLYHNTQNLKIIEETRDHEAYPILEDDAGTHVFRSKVFSSLDYQNELSSFVDYLVFDSIFKDDAYQKKVLALYRNQAHKETIIKDIQDAYQEAWDEGFFFKKTIYKSK